MNPKRYGSPAWRLAMPIARFILYLTRCRPLVRPYMPKRISYWACNVNWAFFDQQWVKDDWRENHEATFRNLINDDESMHR